MPLIKRGVFPALQTSLSEQYISVIIGPRQAGKSTLMNQLINILKTDGYGDNDIAQFNFDLPELRARVSSRPESFLQIVEQNFGQALSSITDRKFIFIDEAQKLPAIFDILKIIHDQHKQYLKIIISGSSSLNLYQHSAETLAGRARFFHVSSLSWRELVAHHFSLNTDQSLISIITKNEFTNDKYLALQQSLFRAQNQIEIVWNNYFLAGGLPEIYLMEKHEQRSLALRDYIATYLDKDIRALSSVGDADIFLSALNYFLQNDSQLINLSSLSESIGLQRVTLKKYLRVLADTFLVSELAPFVRPAKQSIKSPKIYFFDHGLINYAKKIYSLEQLSVSEQFGAAFENIIVNNCLKHFANDPEPGTVNFWRDYQDHEIDIVITGGKNIVPIEITAAAQITRQKTNNFKSFFRAHPECGVGYIVYQGEFQKIAVENKTVFLLPHWMWW
ncbi:ATP-binding protein [Candidatus Gottesmanbacteria bacterium]|nr:ATP-binding protein [Candidatus Gottesmanbacteria bacterium]